MRKLIFKAQAKNIIAVFLIMSLLTAILFIAFAAIGGAIGYAVNLSYARSAPSYATEVSKTCALDGEGDYTFTIPKDKELKILNLTDLHIGGGWGSIQTDRNALKAIHTLVKYSRPDLITITGDTLFPIVWSAGTLNNRKGANLLTALLDSMEVPYAVVFGNHETEGNNTVLDREELGRYYASKEYCLMQTDKTYIDAGGNEVKPYGVGNYVIKVNDEDGTLNTALVFIDSNDYMPGAGGLDWSYDRIHDDQVEWFKQKVDAISELNKDARVLSFFHIPLWEYGDAWTAAMNGDADATLHFGWAGETGGKSYGGKEDSHLFDVMQDFNNNPDKADCVGVFCGHDHYNNYSITYKGIRLTYGFSIDYLAYADIKNQSWQRGGQIVTLKSGSKGLDFDVKPIIYEGIKLMEG